MGLTVLVFIGLAGVTFAVVMLLTRPTKRDREFLERGYGLD